VRLVDPWRTSPLLWTVGVILFTPLIVAVGLFVVAATLAGGLWHGARQTLVSPNAGTAPKVSPVLAPVLPLRPTPADELKPAAAFSRAA
jgi:hypothetical protein